MLKFFIPVEQASEDTIKSLIDMGVLYVNESGMHVNEKSTVTDRKSKQC